MLFEIILNQTVGGGERAEGKNNSIFVSHLTSSTFLGTNFIKKILKIKHELNGLGAEYIGVKMNTS